MDYDLETLTPSGRPPTSRTGPWSGAQRGVRDPGYVPGPYSPFTERYLDLFATWYLGRLHAGTDRPWTPPSTASRRTAAASPSGAASR